MNKDYNIKVFETNLKKYEDWYLKNKELYLLEIRVIKKLLGKKSKEILEIGCGSGMMAKKLGVKYGVDPSEKLIRMARKRGIIAYKAYGEKLPFKDKKFDAVIIPFVMEFVESPLNVINEVFSILKREGKIVIAFINKEQIKVKEKRKSIFFKKARFYTFADIEKMLKEKGFSDIKKITISKQNEIYKITNRLDGEIAFVSAKK